jgi:hypothetical protein
MSYSLADHIATDVPAFQRLHSELIEAVEAGNADALIWTPAYKRTPYTSLQNFVGDEVCGKGDKVLPFLLKLWSQALKSADHGTRLEAQALLADMAKRHAEFNEDEAS